MIEARSLCKQYGSKIAVKDLDLTVHPGELFGFLGPNGAGKTTTIRMLAGLLKPSRGTATVAGFDILKDTLEVKRRIGYMAESPYLYTKLTGREFLGFMGDLYSVERSVAAERAQRLLVLFELEDKADELVESYSHGMRQKIALAGSLIHEPQLLFLDEPTSGLDPRSARVVKDLLVGLAEKGHTVFLSTHILEIAQHMCHRVGIIDQGQLVAVGTLDELRQQARVGQVSLEEIFLQLTGGAEAREVAAFLEGN
ncbi:MAG: ABC transporter ATP-binding protein [Chloroflexota bacterium]|jgi:ABC-2 type transport system ATP-binding protein